jgi:hypothetical protein
VKAVDGNGATQHRRRYGQAWLQLPRKGR